MTSLLASAELSNNTWPTHHFLSVKEKAEEPGVLPACTASPTALGWRWHQGGKLLLPSSV